MYAYHCKQVNKTMSKTVFEGSYVLLHEKSTHKNTSNTSFLTQCLPPHKAILLLVRGNQSDLSTQLLNRLLRWLAGHSSTPESFSISEHFQMNCGTLTLAKLSSHQRTFVYYVTQMDMRGFHRFTPFSHLCGIYYKLLRFRPRLDTKKSK